MTVQQFLEVVKRYFNIMPDMEDRTQVIEQISQGVSFRGANLWVLIFAIFIASLGLNVNSTAVIIGAMLISPLMGPIIGMGLAIGINDIELFKKAWRNFAVATLISVLTAMVYFLVTPIDEAQSELLARTAPTIYDVLIATFGGAAGITALCTRGKGNVIPGVAIATALMPPLCTAGYGLATGNLLYFLGAFYLFFINTVFISLATYFGVRLMHFHRLEFQNPALAKKAQRVVAGIAIVTMIPATIMTVGIVRRSIFDNKVRSFVKVELSQPGTQVLSSNVDEEHGVLNIVAVGKQISDSAEAAAKKRMEQYGLGKYALNIIQGEGSDSILSLSNKLTQINNSRDDERKKLVAMSAEIGELNSRLDSYTKYEELTQEVCSEMKALYPQVKAISISRVAQSSRDTMAVKRFVAAIISLDDKARISPTDKIKLHDWLQARIKADSLVVVY